MRKLFAKRVLAIFMVINAMLPSYAFATAQTWFVNTDCANNGDGTASTCAASVGAAGALTTLDNAIAKIVATVPNFVTSVITGTINLQGATVDTSTPTFAGITTVSSPDRSLTLTVDVANRHPGYRDTTKYTLKNSRAAGVLLTNTKAMTINGLQIVSASNVNADANFGIATNAINASSVLTITNNLVTKEGTTTSAGNYGIEVNGNGEGIQNTNFNIINNFVYGMRGAGIMCVTGSADRCIVYSNTVRNTTGVGVDIYRFFLGSELKIRNNLSYNNSGADYALTGTDGTVTTSTNVTKDATSPNGVGFVSQTVSFGPQTVDGRLTAVSSGATDKGTDLSADANFPFSTDFIGTTRPQGSAWDVGANEMIGSGPSLGAGRFLSLGVGQ